MADENSGEPKKKPYFNLPDMKEFPNEKIITKIDEIQKNAEVNSIKVSAKHDINVRPTRCVANALEDFTRADLQTEALRQGHPHIKVEVGDGVGKLLNDQNCSTGADFIVKNRITNNEMQGQIKCGQNPQNTQAMANEHYATYPEIDVYGPKSHESAGPKVQSKVQFEDITVNMQDRAKLDGFLMKNKYLIEKEGFNFITAEKNLEKVNIKLARAEQNIKLQNQLSAQGIAPRNLAKAEAEFQTLTQEKNQWILQRDLAEDAISKNMSKFYESAYKVEWKAAFAEGAKYGAIAGFVTSGIMALLEDIESYKNGNISVGELALSLGLKCGCATVLGGVLGGLQTMGSNLAKIATTVVSKIGANAAKHAGPILICIVHLMTIGNLIYSFCCKEINAETFWVKVAYKTSIVAISLGAGMLLSTIIPGPLGFVAGIAFGVVVGILDHFFGDSIMNKILGKEEGICAIDMRKIMENLHGLYTEAFETEF